MATHVYLDVRSGVLLVRPASLPILFPFDLPLLVLVLVAGCRARKKIKKKGEKQGKVPQIIVVGEADDEEKELKK